VARIPGQTSQPNPRQQVIVLPTEHDRSEMDILGSHAGVLEQTKRAPLADSSRGIAAGLIHLISGGDNQDLLGRALDDIASHFSCDLVEINRFDESQGFFVPVRWASPKGRLFITSPAAARYQLGEGYTGWLAEHRSPLLLSDTHAHPDPSPKGGLDGFPFRSYLGVPLLWEDTLLGTVEIAHQKTAFFSELDRDALAFIASQIALGLNINRLQQREGQHQRQAVLSDAINQLGDQIGDLDRLWESLSRVFLDQLQLNCLGLFLPKADTTELLTPYFFRKRRKGWDFADASLSAPLGSDIAAIWLHQDYWLSNQVEAGLLAGLGLKPTIKRLSVSKILLVPLLVGTQRVGLMILGRSKRLPDFKEDESKSLMSLGRQAAILLQSSRQISQIASSAPSKTGRSPKLALNGVEPLISHGRMAELLRLSAELTASLDIDRSLGRVLKQCNELIPAERSVLVTRDLATSELSLRQVMPEPGVIVSKHVDPLLSTSLSISEWVIAQRQTLMIDDLRQDGRWQLEPYNSVLAIACLAGDEIIGVLLFFAKPEAAFGSEQQAIGQFVARQMASALNNTYLYSVIHEQADRLGLMLRSHQVETSQSNAILEAIADGVIVTDADHRVILFNAAAERILNLTSIQVVGKEVFDFIGIFGAETIQWGETIHQWRLSPPQDHPRSSTPERMILEDGRVISILPAPVVLGGDFLGTVSIFRDITRDVEVDRLKSEFVATVSHELRTPMTSIKGFVDLMLMGASGDLNDEQRHFLDIVRTNTHRLEILVNDLLDISRIEAGKASLVFKDLDVHQLLMEMELYLQQRGQEESKSMQFRFQAPEKLPTIWGDLERVRQIMANIVENSFAYTPEGGLIEVSARQVDGQVEIEVRDNGMGISLEEQERIFERFYRGEQSLIMGVSGTGLGLAIVLNLVEMHQGRIWVTSEGIPGKGTTFTVSLPSAPQDNG
jgi:PAS domain S-box-containing protein